MRFEIIDETKNKDRFVLKTYDRYTVEDNILMLKQLTLHRHWRKGLDVLVDHRQVSFESVEVTDVSEISTVIVALDKQYGTRRCAIVTPLVGHGLVALYKYDVDSKVDMETKIFGPNDYEKAVSWLETEAQSS